MSEPHYDPNDGEWVRCVDCGRLVPVLVNDRCHQCNGMMATETEETKHPIGRYFTHHCDLPRRLSFRRRTVTCEVCGATWQQETKGSWRTERDGEPVLIGAVVLWPDGTVHTFGEDR